MTNLEIAQLINESIGESPIPFEDVRDLAISIYRSLGGREDDENFENIFEILLSIVPLTSLIDDTSIYVDKTWSSYKINSELESVNASIDNISELIPLNASTTNKLTDKAYVDTAVADATYDDTEIRGLINAVDEKVDGLDDFDCSTIVPTTTNFVEGTSYTIHEALQRTANLFGGIQGEIDDINGLIPNQATTQNQLADKDFVNSTVATNAANFRGSWNNWVSVPTNASQYPEDYVGNRKPTNNDYMIVQDASDYSSADFNDSFTIFYRTIIGPGNNNFYWTYNGVTHKVPYFNAGTLMGPNNELKVISVAQVEILKTVRINDVIYMAGEVWNLTVNENYTVYTTTTTQTYEGQWRFQYVGDWDTNGKLRWRPQYQIGSSFTAAQQAAIDSGITAAKVTDYDNYDASIVALRTDKLDKVYTANKIYGTNAEGTQISYTAGTGISFANGQISNTNTDAAWGNITGTLSNQTDLSTALDAKLDALTPGSNISINNGVISATDTTYSVATQLANGLMSSTDKTKLDSLSNYTLPTASANTLGGIKVGSNLSIDANGVLSAQAVQTLTEGDGIDITNNVVSVDTSVIQPKLTAGEGITIINNVIAATGGGSGGTHTTYLFSDADASAGIYSTDIQNFYIACIGNQTIQDVMISIDETYTDPSTGETAIAHNFYYPSAQRMYEGNVELWLLYTEDCITWENRYYLINSTVTRTVTTGTFGVQNS